MKRIFVVFVAASSFSFREQTERFPPAVCECILRGRSHTRGGVGLCFLSGEESQ